MLSDISQVYGQDIQASSTGDLLTVSGMEMGKQRILRRLMVSAGSYIFHTLYGAGLPSYIGELMTPTLLEKIRTTVLSNMYEENTVAKTPVPVIVLQPISNGLIIQVSYTYKATNQKDILTFTVSRNGITT